MSADPATYTRSVKAVLLNRILLVLAFAGLFVAGVLSLGHAVGLSIPCGGSNDCDVVARHPASSLLGIPVAYFGFATYAALAVVACLRAARGMVRVNQLVIAGYVLAAVGTVFSLYLQYQSIFVIHATCKWCVASATIMVLTLVGHAVLAQSMDDPIGDAGTPARGSGLDSALMIGLPLVVVLGMAVIGTNLGNERSNTGLKENATPITPDIYQKLVAGEPHALGDKNAPITIIEFADLQCGACQTTSPKVKAFVEESNDKVRMIFHHFPLAQKHQWAMPAAAVSEYAAEKGKFWDFTMAVMALNRELQGVEELYDIAGMVGLDKADLEKRLSNDKDAAYSRVTKDMDWADKLGIQLTPTFFIVTNGGKDVEIATSGNIFEKLQQEKYKKYLANG